MKFGGSSLSDGKLIRNSSKIIQKFSKGNNLVVVVSAIGETTDNILKMINQAIDGDEEKVKITLNKIRINHEKAAKESISNKEYLNEAIHSISSIFSELEKLILAITTIKEITARSNDFILSFGEELSSLLLEFNLKDVGLKSCRFKGGEAGIITDDFFGEASPLMEVTKSKIRSRLTQVIQKGIIPVVSGFTGITQDGYITTLGRGGSDYSATIIAVAIGADEVCLWSDVDGIMTGDPRIIDNATIIPKLTYAEALEMTAFGAKAIHPRALEPVADEKIPVKVRNTFASDLPGTLIVDDAPSKPKGIVKALALVRDVGLITISGAGMVGKPGTSAKIFEVIQKSKTNILMISQSISEANIGIIVRRNALHHVTNTLEMALLGKGVVTDIIPKEDVNVIAALGEGMRGTPGVAAKIFSSISKKGINIIMIAQGSSELGVSFVVSEKDAEDAIRTIHEDLKLNDGAY